MPAYLITYDLDKPGQDYSGLIRALRANGAVEIQRSVWVEQSAETSVQVRDRYFRHMDGNDRLFVGELTANWAAQWLMNQDAALRILPRG